MVNIMQTETLVTLDFFINVPCSNKSNAIHISTQILPRVRHKNTSFSRTYLGYPGRLECALEQGLEVERLEPRVLLDVLDAALEVAQAGLNLTGQQTLHQVLQRKEEQTCEKKI